jgi:hypothetical protein
MSQRASQCAAEVTGSSNACRSLLTYPRIADTFNNGKMDILEEEGYKFYCIICMKSITYRDVMDVFCTIVDRTVYQARIGYIFGVIS